MPSHGAPVHHGNPRLSMSFSGCPYPRSPTTSDSKPDVQTAKNPNIFNFAGRNSPYSANADVAATTLGPGRPIELNNKGTQPQFSPENQIAQTPTVTPIERFETLLVDRTQSLLKANRDRLNTQQADYIQDKNPNSRRWQELWQVNRQRQGLVQQQQDLKARRDEVSAELQRVGDTPFMSDGLGSTAQDIQKSLRHQQLLKLSEQSFRVTA